MCRRFFLQFARDLDQSRLAPYWNATEQAHWYSYDYSAKFGAFVYHQGKRLLVTTSKRTNSQRVDFDTMKRLLRAVAFLLYRKARVALRAPT